MTGSTRFPSHYAYRNPVGSDPQAIIDASVAALRAKIAELGADRVAAFYVEPIQGSGGVLVPPAGWLKAMRAVCAEHDILFVADEVITGFGRTGPLFACEEDDVVPDLMTTAKGLTSGYVPMGAVFMSDHVYNTIADGAGKAAVGHGYTYSAHPVSAAVGLDCLRLYEDGLLDNGRKGWKASDGRPPLTRRSPAGRRRSWSRHAGRDRTCHRQGAQNAVAAGSRSVAPHLRPRLEERPCHPRLRQRRARLRPAALLHGRTRSTESSNARE